MHDLFVILADGLACTVTFGFNFAGHWFPWRAFPFLVDERGELHRLLAYVHGTLSIVVGVVLAALWRSLAGEASIDVWDAVLFYLCDVAAAGLGTLVPYAIDSWAHKRTLEADRDIYEQAIQS
jgi:hypothetical protein